MSGTFPGEDFYSLGCQTPSQVRLFAVFDVKDLAGMGVSLAGMLGTLSAQFFGTSVRQMPRPSQIFVSPNARCLFGLRFLPHWTP